MDAFAFAAMKCADAFHAFARGEGVTHNVKCVFEKGDPEEHLRDLFREHGYEIPYFTWSTPHRDRKGFTHDPFIGSQAAGWIACEYYLDADRLFYSEPTERWALKQFQSSWYIFVQSRGVLLPNPPDPRRMYESIRESIERLEKARREGLASDSGEAGDVEV